MELTNAKIKHVPILSNVSEGTKHVYRMSLKGSRMFHNLSDVSERTKHVYLNKSKFMILYTRLELIYGEKQ